MSKHDILIMKEIIRKEERDNNPHSDRELQEIVRNALSKEYNHYSFMAAFNNTKRLA